MKEVSEAVFKVAPKSSVYLADRSVPDTALESCVQIVPSGPEAMFPRSGTGGVKETFEITAWKRVAIDARGKMTESLSSIQQGLVATLLTPIRRRMKLNNLGGRLHVGMLFIRSARPSGNQVGNSSAWVSVADTYEARYELDDVED